ncbi:hypothetical protein P280DRAFT_61248 [Massarina eburnea CBS 473.64]|uniref:SGNH hydrolase n=1 Tax=Massarina eburnea CBS 473.64 TaxID=1395130 RepID=A0A6A6RV11_9PLEO|nr:hypothetical protein P280DRAFT_61248 [Massarina eburnea CBS 473.64]
MRFLNRLHACFIATVLFVLYFWLRPNDYMQDNIQRVWNGRAHRVVVFGDDWSDTGSYRVAAPPRALARDRDPLQGERWVEGLCEDLNCDFIDNFARSAPSNVKMNTVGSVVNADIFANATSDGRSETLMLFDFKTQVEQFIAWEEKRGQIPARLRTVDEWTVFTVFFGTWDLLEYSALENEKAIQAIDRSVVELMRNLDILADHVDGPVKVVIPRLMDVTFLPRYSNRKNESTTVYAMDQHQSVFLWTYWNQVLSQAMVEWSRGDLYVPDLHGIVMNQVRAKQLYSQQITDATGYGKQEPLFDDVKQPCLTTSTNTNGTAGQLQAPGIEMCSEPTRHLFWNDLLLSGPAHQLIGTEAARLVRSNVTINIAAREKAQQQQDSVASHKNQRKGDGNLKLPPGY